MLLAVTSVLPTVGWLAIRKHMSSIALPLTSLNSLSYIVWWSVLAGECAGLVYV